MANNLLLLRDLLYGAVLLTAITMAPEVMVDLHLEANSIPVIFIRYQSLGIYMIGALLITGLVVASRSFRCHFLLLLTWIVLCFVKFTMNFKMQVFAIQEVFRYGMPVGPIIALIGHSIAFLLAVELMLYWVANTRLIPSSVVINIEVHQQRALE